MDVDIAYINGSTYYTAQESYDESTCRRTVYRFSPRGGRSALLDTFDCPDPAAPAPRRSTTTTPLQALSLLNNAFVLEMAEALASCVREQAGLKTADQVTRCYELVLTRGAEPEELKLAGRLVDQYGLKALCRALLNSNEFVMLE